MNYDHYSNVRFSEDYNVFIFNSVGPKGTLIKAIVYDPIKNLQNGYNLGFGTLKTGEDGSEYLDDTEISNNGDRDKLLATVAVTAQEFLDKYPERKIYIRGSNSVRTRLYQMAISHAYDELSKRLVIMGDKGTKDNPYDMYPFERGVNYWGFLIQKR